MTNVFEGKLVRLRAVEPLDWETHYRWDRDESDMGRLSSDIAFPSSTLRAQAWAEHEAKRSGENDNFRFQIEMLGGELVGTLLTHHCDLRNGTFMHGIAILPQHRRKGYSSEAIPLLLRFYFNERRYQKCNAEVYGFNEPSQRLHERLGFTLEGRLRRMIFTDGQFHDVLIYGITREEFEERQGQI